MQNWIALLVALFIIAVVAYYVSTVRKTADRDFQNAQNLTKKKEEIVKECAEKLDEAEKKVQRTTDDMKFIQLDLKSQEEKTATSMKEAQDLKAALVMQETLAINAINEALAAKAQYNQAQTDLNSVNARLAAIPAVRTSQTWFSTGKDIGGRSTGMPVGLVYCPYENDYLDKLNVVSDGDFITGVSASCALPRADGSKYTSPWFGSSTGSKVGSIDISGGLISGRAGDWLDRIGGVGGTGGGPWNFSCPSGKISAIAIDRNDKYVVNIKPYCSDAAI